MGLGARPCAPTRSFAGFGCMGFGLANVVPVLFSAAGSTPGVSAGSGIAAVATAGYCGFLVGPPLIGFVAQATTLSVGLGVVVLFTALIAVMAGRVGRVELASAIPR